MGHYPQLDLSRIILDPDLARQLPYGVSSYYLALPLARKNGRVSVVMAYPENTAALDVLGRQLDTKIVPIADSASAIKSALECLYQPAAVSSPPRLLAWNDTPSWQTAVADSAAALGDALRLSVNTLAPPIALSDMLALAGEGNYALTVLHLPEGNIFADFLSRSATPVLLVRGEYAPPQHDGLRASLKFRQGDPVSQVVDELAQRECDLLVVAAEAEGKFVARVLAAIAQRRLHAGRPIFILKPSNPLLR